MADKHLASRDFLEFSIPRAGKSKKKKLISETAFVQVQPKQSEKQTQETFLHSVGFPTEHGNIVILRCSDIIFYAAIRIIFRTARYCTDGRPWED